MVHATVTGSTSYDAASAGSGAIWSTGLGDFAGNADGFTGFPNPTATFGLDDSDPATQNSVQLVYSGHTTGLSGFQPVVVATLETYAPRGVPSSIELRLTWNGVQGPWVTFQTTGHAAGDKYLLAAQVPPGGAPATGFYDWLLEATIHYTDGDVLLPAKGRSPIAVRSSADETSGIGYGWDLAGHHRLYLDNDSTGKHLGAYLVRDTGHGWYFKNVGIGTQVTYESPENDFGTLVKNLDGSYTYTNTHQTKWNFSSLGYLNTVVDPHNLALTYVYTGSQLTKIQSPDGTTTTFNYSGSWVSGIVMPGNRTMTLTRTGNDLTGITDVDSSLRTFTYSDHLMTSDRWGPRVTSYAYSTGGRLSGVDYGAGSVYTIEPAVTRGLKNNPAYDASWEGVGVVKDPLNRATTYTFNPHGHALKMKTPDGATHVWDINDHLQVTKHTDPLGRITQYGYDNSPTGKGDLVLISLPDLSNYQFGYDPTFHLPTAVTDTLNNQWQYAYNATRDLINVIDPLLNTTTLVWSNGLLTSVTEPDPDGIGPLGSAITTLVYDTAKRRLTSLRDAANGLTTLTYDANGFVQTVKDALSHVTTTVYDARGRLTQLTTPDPDGTGPLTASITTFVYDAPGNVIRTINPRGFTTTYTYTDPRGLLTQVTEPDPDGAGSLTSPITTMVYDTVMDLTTVIDARGNRTTFSYDSLHRLKTTLHAENGLATYTYNVAGELTSYLDELNHGTSYQYNNRGWVNKITDALNKVTTIVYDTEGNVTQAIDALNRTTSVVYDQLNRVESVTEAVGTPQQRTSTFVYDPVGNLTRTINPRGFTTTIIYDVVDRPTRIEQPDPDGIGPLLSPVSTIVYDAVGNVTSTIDPLNHRTTYTYDNADRLTKVQTPDPDEVGVATTTIVYDKNDNVTSVVNPRTFTTSMVYDNLDRMTSVREAVGQSIARTTTFVYDANDNVTTVIDPRTNRTTFVYDKANRLIARTDQLSHTTTINYDAAHNVTSVVDPLLFRVTYTYDAVNRPETVKYPDNGVATVVYDAVGNVLSTVNPLGNRTTYVYDALNRPYQRIQPDPDGGGPLGNPLTSIVYDANDNVTAVTDPKNNTTAFLYDNLDRLIQETDPLTKNTTYAYDSASRLTGTTDRLGQKKEFTYNDADLLKTQVWKTAGGATVNTFTYTYDSNGNLLTAKEADGTYTMTYDALDRVGTVKEPFSLTLTFTYDANDNRTKVQDNFSGGVTTSVYDAANRLTMRQFAGTGGSTPLRVDLTYTDRDQLASVTRYSNLAGTTKVGSTLYSYDGNGRMETLKHRDAVDAIFSNTTYTYDLNGRLQTEKVNSVVTTFIYDTTDQLTGATGGRTENYSYDENGNRTMAGYQTGTGNRITSDGTWTYTHDNAGNLIKKSLGANAETWTYGYDHDNRMIWAEKRATDGGTLQMRADYKYDAFGNRIEKAVDPDGTGGQPTTTTRFGYDGTDIWADLTSTNTLETRYLRGDMVDELFARIKTGTPAWYDTDRLGSVTHIVNNSGTVIDQLSYDSYGNVLSETNPSNGDRWKWTGKERDGETGWQLNDARSYASTIGRWTSEDPIKDDINPYRYVRNSPTNSIDPTGLQAQEWQDTGRTRDIQVRVEYFEWRDESAKYVKKGNQCFEVRQQRLWKGEAFDTITEKEQQRVNPMARPEAKKLQKEIGDLNLQIAQLERSRNTIESLQIGAETLTIVLGVFQWAAVFLSPVKHFNPWVFGFVTGLGLLNVGVGVGRGWLERRYDELTAELRKLQGRVTKLERDLEEMKTRWIEVARKKGAVKWERTNQTRTVEKVVDPKNCQGLNEGEARDLPPAALKDLPDPDAPRPKPKEPMKP